MAPMSLPPSLQPCDLGADVEVLMLDSDHRQPPVTGGKKAISRAVPIARIVAHMALVDGGADHSRSAQTHWSNSGPRVLSQAISSATVATSRGSSTSSAATADLLLDPGEIEKPRAHRSSSSVMTWLTAARR